MNDNAGKFLTQQLYPDLKNWIPTLFKKLKTPIEKRLSTEFQSPSALLNALKRNEISANSWVSLKCKPMLFGPYLRHHFLSPIVGHHTKMRLGPRVVTDNPALGLLAQATTHLKPVGLFPPIGDDLHQICLYPGDANAVGMVGMMPGIDELVSYMPAVASSKNVIFCGMPCNVMGIIRQVPAKLFTDVGVTIERWEESRQAGNVWFIDLSVEGTESEPMGKAEPTEIWGGMYASGHLEIRDGKLDSLPLFSNIVDIFRENNFEPYVTQDKAETRSTVIYSKGCRFVCGFKDPIFSLHMDAELAIEYKNNRAKFDRMSESILLSIVEICRSQSVELINPHDLDFSYTNSTRAFTVLKSLGSEYISDPLLVAIRDWHRSRGR